MSANRKVAINGVLGSLGGLVMGSRLVFIGRSLRGWGLVGAAMVDLVGWFLAFRGCCWRIHFYIDVVNGAVWRGRGEGDAVFVANELGDLTVGFFESFGVFREVGATTSGLGNGLELGVGDGKRLA